MCNALGLFPFKLISVDSERSMVSYRKINFLYMILLSLDTEGGLKL